MVLTIIARSGNSLSSFKFEFEPWMGNVCATVSFVVIWNFEVLVVEIFWG